MSGSMQKNTEGYSKSEKATVKFAKTYKILMDERRHDNTQNVMKTDVKETAQGYEIDI